VKKGADVVWPESITMVCGSPKRDIYAPSSPLCLC
jgi:hypothetical protein